MQSKAKMVLLAQKILNNIGSEVTILKFVDSSYDSLYDEDKEKKYTSSIVQGKVQVEPSEEEYKKMGADVEKGIIVTTVTEDTTVNYDDLIKYNGKEYDIIKIQKLGQYSGQEGEEFIITKILGEEQ